MTEFRGVRRSENRLHAQKAVMAEDDGLLIVE